MQTIADAATVMVASKVSSGGVRMTREPLLTLEDAAARLGCSEECLAEWVDEGRITALRIGRLLRFDPADFEVAPPMEEQEPESEPEPEQDTLPELIEAAGIVEGLPLVYVIEAGAAGPVKIGIVRQLAALRPRVRMLQVGCPYRLKVIRLIQGGIELETALHQRLYAARIRGEWFKRAPVLAYFDGQGAELTAEESIGVTVRTPDEWLALLYPGCRIMDPDGWRGANAPEFDLPITEKEFRWRFTMSTIRRPGAEA